MGVAAVILAVAATLTWVAWPRLQASVHYLPVDTALTKYFETREIPSAQLEGLVERARGAIDLHAHHRYWDGLSLLLYLRGLDEQTPIWLREPALFQSIRAAEQSVRRAPAKPRAWLRIARLRAYLGQEDDAVIPPLKMSILTGRVEPTLFLTRLQLAFSYLPRLDEETRSLLRDQAVLAWQVEPRAFTSYLRDGRIGIEQVRGVLGPADADVLLAMEAAL